MHVRKGLYIFPVVMGFLLLLLVTDECFSNFMEIYESWVLLARDT